MLYFLQEFGEPLRLRYQKHVYGPYADNLRHVLLLFEGHYLEGFGDGTKNKPDTKITILHGAVGADDRVSVVTPLLSRARRERILART